jgi:hypothetical protein
MRAVFDALGTTALLVEIMRLSNESRKVLKRQITLYSRMISEGAYGDVSIAQFIQVRFQRFRT